MDKIKKYEEIVLKILQAYSKIKYSNIDAQNELIIDKANHRYQVVTLGWNGYKRVYSCPVHFDIINGKIWIQNDQTEYGIANDLVESGVPKSDIVLGYYSPKRREGLGFALA